MKLNRGNIVGKLQELTYNLLPKRIGIISKGEKIFYVQVPKFIIGGSGGLVLCNKKSGKLMILIAKKKDKFLRYTIYHEYIEGKIFQSKKTKQQILDFITSKLHLFFAIYRIDQKQIPMKDFLEALKKRVSRDGAHWEALLREIQLAKKELSKDKLVDFYIEVIRRDRFKVLPPKSS